jgi:glycerophosphoryl diester phosphodiesterase
LRFRRPEWVNEDVRSHGIGKVRRVGHAGASGVVRGNTLASFDAALEIGVDMVEFDVRAWAGRLVLAHTLLHARMPGCVPLERALDHLAGQRFARVELNVDVKDPGMEAPLLAALRERELLERSLISSQLTTVLERVRELEPAVRTGISVGGALARRWARVRDWRAQALDALGAGRCDALMAQHALVDARLVADVQERGRQLYAWTVNDRPGIDRLDGLGVDGIISGDPRLFA